MSKHNPDCIRCHNALWNHGNCEQCQREAAQSVLDVIADLRGEQASDTRDLTLFADLEFADITISEEQYQDLARR